MFYLKKHMLRHLAVFAFILSSAGLQAQPASLTKSAPLLSFKVLKSFPHDTSHYTEGLAFQNGNLLESAGQYGKSGLYEIDIKTGKTLRSRKVDPQFFAEGIAIAGDRIVQLTWREQTAFVYDLAFNLVGTLNYGGEGWGLASLDKANQLVMSDGSPILRFLDGKDYHFLRQITVHDGTAEVMRLNELEVANGLIYANVWLTDMIVVIDPTDGHVVNWLDMSPLRALFKRGKDWNEVDNVLNGIAYDPRSGHFYVTGKYWPVLFEISINMPKRKH